MSSPPSIARSEINKEAMKRLRRIAKSYHDRSNWRGFAVIASDWFSIVGLAVFCEYLRLVADLSLWVWMPIYILCMVVAASRFRGLENLVHEAGHYNLFATREWNNQLDFLSGIAVFRHIKDYRESHNRHHLSLGHQAVDPDLARYADWGILELPKNFWWIMVVRPFTGFLTFHYLLHEFKNFWVSPTRRIARTVFWAGVLIVVALTGIWFQMLLYWVVPFFLILPITRFWSIVSEHGGLDLTSDVASSRNTLGNRLHQMIFFPHYDGYHETHHLYPSIPWYRLAEATQALEADPYFKEYHHQSQNIYITAEYMAEHSILLYEDPQTLELKAQQETM